MHKMVKNKEPEEEADLYLMSNNDYTKYISNPPTLPDILKKQIINISKVPFYK